MDTCFLTTRGNKTTTAEENSSAVFNLTDGYCQNTGRVVKLKNIMADEQKPVAPQTGPAGQSQKGIQIRTMKSDIEALQKKPGAAPVKAVAVPFSPLPPKPAVPVSPVPPLAGGLAPAIKPPITPVVPPIAKPPVSPVPILSVPAAPRPSVLTPPVVPPPPVGGPVVPPAARAALPPIAPVAVPKPVPPAGGPAAGIPPFRPAVPPVIPPAPAAPRPAAPIPPLSAMPIEISAEEGGRERIMFLVKRIALFGGLAVVIGGIAGVVIYYLVPPAAPLSPKTPAALFAADNVKIIDLGQEPERVLADEINALGSEALGSEKSFTQILFKTETEKCFTLKRNCVVESRYLKPEEIYGVLGASVPPYLKDLTNDNFTLFVYNQDGSTRFGAVILSSDSEAAFAGLSAEESGLAGYWELLTGAAIPSPEGYKDSVYQNINIRYLNLPDPYLAVDYAAYPARNYLLFATSRESIFALIDRLFEMEGK